MDGTIDDRYFEWLYGQIDSVKATNPSRTHWELARVLYTTQYDWFIHNDDNRVADGRELRYEFMDEWGAEGIDRSWLELGCSLLEMFIGLSRRASFLGGSRPDEWFWHFMDNLDIKKYTDRRFSGPGRVDILRVLEAFNQRRYARDGTGGIFPLRYTTRDQRKVELWYQLQAYLIENDDIEALIS